MHGIESQPGAVLRESEVVALERPELGLGHLGGGARFHIEQHHGAAAVDEGELFPFPVSLQAVGIVFRPEYRRLSGASVGCDPEEIGPAAVRPRVVDGLAVIGPDHLIHPLVRRGVQLPEVLAFRIGDIQAAADDQRELLSVRGNVRRRGRLPFKSPADLDAAGSEPDLRDRHLRGGRFQDMDLIVLQEHDGRPSERDGRILDGLVEGGELLRLSAFDILDDVGLFVQLIADIVDVAVLVGHGPLVLADVVGQFLVGLCAGIPALDVGIVVPDIAFPGGETDALHGLVEEEFTRLGVLGEVDDGVEIAVEHPLRGAARDGHLEGGLAGAFARGLEIDPVRLRRPAHRHVRRFVERQLDGLSTGDRNDIDVVVALDVGTESQPFTIRGNERGILHPRHRDDGRGLATRDGDAIDVSVIAEINLLPVRRKRRVRRETDVVGQGNSSGGHQNECQQEELLHIGQTITITKIALFLIFVP